MLSGEHQAVLPSRESDIFIQTRMFVRLVIVDWRPASSRLSAPRLKVISSMMHRNGLFFCFEQGEQATVTDFGGIDGVPGYDLVWKPLLQAGYEVGKTLFPAPYDWRGPASAFSDLYRNVTALVGCFKCSMCTRLQTPAFPTMH